MIARTQFFSNCAAVFEGGGVRAAAFAGAFAAADSAGIGFVRLAGTSAGSIVAALIAAGATPDFITERLLEKDFKDFLRAPEKKDATFPKPSMLKKAVRGFLDESTKQALFLTEYGGLYKSDEIQIWVESMLKELLRRDKPDVVYRPVRFSDLVLPCTIVAADIAVSGPRVWSLEHTPNEDVAFAVRCSSNIPFFFQPIWENNHVMVDGGMLSNLPTFVFANSLAYHAGRFSERVLAFRLRDDGALASKKIDNILDFGRAVANTVVNGSTAIQIEMQPDVFTIDIPTGSIQATDFDRISKEEKELLYNYGMNSVASFVKSERGIVSKLRSATKYEGFEERLLVYVQVLGDADNSVWISDQSTYWTWFIFPSLFSAVRRGVEVHLVTTTPRNDHTATDEIQRRILLSRMGVRIHIVDATPFNGVLRDPNTPNEFAALSSVQGYVNTDFQWEAEQVRTYSISEDSPVVESIRRAIVLPQVSNGPNRNFTLQPCSDAKLMERLSRVPQYKNATFETAIINIDANIKITQKFVKEYKFMQIDSLIEDFRSSGIELFHPQELVFEDGATSIVSPPIFESYEDGFVLIDGHTRMLHCMKAGVRSIRGLLVKKVSSPLPGKPFELNELRVATHTLSIKSNMKNFNGEHFRRIDECLRPHEENSGSVYRMYAEGRIG